MMCVPDLFPACYVLTAPHGNDKRQQSAVSQLTDCGIRHQLVAGYAPQDPAITSSYSAFLNALLAKRSLSKGEVATYLGHRKIWRMIVENGEQCALVLEDDFLLADPDTFRSDIDTVSRYAEDFDLIKLFDYQKRQPVYTVEDGRLSFSIYSRPNSGMVGYVLTRACCEKLLRRRHVFRPVDEELRFWFELKIRIVSAEPNLVSDNGAALDGSLLDHERDRIRARKNIVRSIHANVLAGYVNLRSRAWSRHVVRSVDSDLAGRRP